MQSNGNHTPNNPPIFSPASDASALLFALLPCVHESFLPLFRFLFLFLELSEQNFSKLNLPPINSSPKTLLDTVFPNKDTLLKSLNFYGSLFGMPLLNTLSGLLQALQFYDAYKDIFAGFSSAPSSGLFAGLNGMSPEALAGLMGMFSGNTPSGESAESGAAGDTNSGEPVESDAVDDNNSGELVKNSAFDGNNFGVPMESSMVDDIASGTVAENDTASDTNFGKPVESGIIGGTSSGEPVKSGANSDITSGTAAESGTADDNSASNSNSGNSGNNPISGNSGNFQDNSNTSLFQDLYKMLTPEQQAIYEKLMQE